MDAKVKKLEARMRRGSVPGTTFARTLMDTSLVERYGLRIPNSGTPKESYLVWSLAVGELMEPKKFYYGFTMEEALRRAAEDQGIE